MPRTPAARRYAIEIKDAKGAVVFCAVVRWNDKNKRSAFAQIERLARLPEVSFYTGLTLAPDAGNSKRQPKPGMRRPRREPC